jgi:2'-5' RNA ligase
LRLFIAINLHPAVQRGLAAAVEPLRKVLPDARWVPDDLLHLTVKFLGKQTESRAAAIAAQLDMIALRFAEIPFTLSGVGAFPNFRKAAVVWMAVHCDAKLELLFHDVESGCAELGLPVDGRPFRPHVTFGRIKQASPSAIREFASACAGIQHEARTSAGSLDLMLSEQRGGRLKYTSIHNARLGKTQ